MSESDTKKTGKGLTPHAIKLIKQVKFLKVFAAKNCDVKRATKAAGISERTFHRWWQEPEFRSRVHKLLNSSELEFWKAAKDRAIKGYKKPVFYQGLKVGTTQEYSDILLMFCLKAIDNSRYGDGRKPAEAADDLAIPETQYVTLSPGEKPPEDEIVH